MRQSRDDNSSADAAIDQQFKSVRFESIQIRPIRRSDNQRVANLIREVMTEFGCVGPGYSCEDPEVDDMFESYSGDQSAFFVVEDGQVVLGCGGVAPLEGGDDDVCELRKMYFYDAIRGHGFGRRMLQQCLETAKSLGFRICYLETVERMTVANSLYQKSGFERLSAPLGDTGHTPCNAWYSINLTNENVSKQEM